MSSYDLLGLISSVAFLLCVAGVFDQLRIIWKRKAESDRPPGYATSIISPNRFLVSFFSFYSFLCYGLVIDRFNHYLVWPRFIATSLVLLIMREIYLDTRTRTAKIYYGTCIFAMLIPIALISFQHQFDIAHVKSFFSGLIILMIFLLSQAAVVQISKVIRAKATGALSLRFQQFTLLKDLTGIGFAYTMGFKDGWPIVAMHLASAIDKSIMISLFFRYKNRAVKSDLTEEILV